MAVDVETRILTARPRAEVAAYASDPGNAPRWHANIKAVEWKTPPPLRIGSRIEFVAHFLGRQLAYVYEIVELIRDERVVMRTAHGPFSSGTTYLWESADDGTPLMKLRNRGEPRGFSRLAAPFMQFAMRRANQKDLLRRLDGLKTEKGSDVFPLSADMLERSISLTTEVELKPFDNSILSAILVRTH